MLKDLGKCYLGLIQSKDLFVHLPYVVAFHTHETIVFVHSEVYHLFVVLEVVFVLF